EYLLRRVYIHHGQVATESARHSGRAHDAAYSELSITGNGRQRKAAVHTELIALGKFLRNHQSVRLGQEDEGIVNNRFVRILQFVVAKAAVAGHVDAENQDV